MFSHLRAVLLATGSLVLASTLYSVATATAGTAAAIALVPGSSVGVQSAQVRAVTGASIRAIAIGY
jgi:hypothetical protein